MAIAKNIDRVDDRYNAVDVARRAAMPARAHTNSLRHYDDHDPAALKKGVLTLVSAGEGQYAQGYGMAGKEGTQRLLLIGHLMVGETDAQETIQAAEFALIEEIKSFVRTPVSGIGLRLESIQHSRQLDHPYGWVVAYLDAGPSVANLS